MTKVNGDCFGRSEAKSVGVSPIMEFIKTALQMSLNDMYML